MLLRRHGLKLPAGWDRSRDPDAGIVSQPRPAAVHARPLAGGVFRASGARHDALGDAFAAAQLLLVVLAELKRQRSSTVEELIKAECDARWLARH